MDEWNILLILLIPIAIYFIKDEMRAYEWRQYRKNTDELRRKECSKCYKLDAINKYKIYLEGMRRNIVRPNIGLMSNTIVDEIDGILICRNCQNSTKDDK